MPQDRATGAEANNFGRQNAARIAKTIGATLLDWPKSNVASHGGRRVVLKSAHATNTYIGVPYTLLDTLSAVIAAFEEEPGHFVVIELSAKTFREEQKPQSKRPTGQVKKSVFFTKGKVVGGFVAEG